MVSSTLADTDFKEGVKSKGFRVGQRSRRRGALRTCARDRIWFYCRHISRFYIRCNRLKKTRSALNIIDESFCFLEADSSGQAIEFNGLKLVTSVKGVNNLGG